MNWWIFLFISLQIDYYTNRNRNLYLQGGFMVPLFDDLSIFKDQNLVCFLDC